MVKFNEDSLSLSDRVWYINKVGFECELDVDGDVIDISGDFVEEGNSMSGNKTYLTFNTVSPYITEDIYDEILTYIRGEMDYLSEDCSCDDCDNWDDCNDCDNIYCRGKDE